MRVRLVAAMAAVFVLTLASAPARAAAGAGGPAPSVTFTGSIVTVHADYSMSVRETVLVVGDKRYVLDSTRPLGVRPRDRVVVHGELTRAESWGGEIAVDTVEPDPDAPAAPAPAAATGTHSVLVVLAEWSGALRDGVTPAQAAAQIATDDNAWYQEVSDGQLSFTATSTGWLTLSSTAEPCNDSYAFLNEALVAATNAGYTPADYTHVMVYFNKPCSYAGLGEVGGKYTWISQELDRRVTVHELGHNLGLWHANAAQCTNEIFVQVPWADAGCTHVEYGDGFDAMGTGFNGVGQFNASQQAILGWLGGGRSAAVTSGTYTIAPLETVGATLQALTITSNGRAFWVEYRQPTGVDSFLTSYPHATDGVLVHTAAASPNFGSWLLDMTADGSFVNTDAALAAGQSWSDGHGLTISVTAAGTSGATIVVNGAAAPALSISDAAVTEGDSGTKNLTFSCVLSFASASTITVKAATAPGSATPPGDYTTTSKTITFLPGVVKKNFVVPIKGDLIPEAAETFTVTLSNAAGAPVSDGVAIGTINDNDALASPTLTVADLAINEGDSGTKSMSFKIKLSSASASSVTVKVATADGTAVAPGDYASKVATVTIPAGQVVKTFTVAIKGDTVAEPNETFTVNLSQPTGATIADGQAVGTISNDDIGGGRIAV